MDPKKKHQPQGGCNVCQFVTASDSPSVRATTVTGTEAAAARPVRPAAGAYTLTGLTAALLGSVAVGRGCLPGQFHPEVRSFVLILS